MNASHPHLFLAGSLVAGVLIVSALLTGCQDDAPVISMFAADRDPITAGSSAHLIATFSGGTGRLEPGSIFLPRSTTVSTGPLSIDRTYRLTVVRGTRRTSRLCSVHVVPAAQIVRFTASPAIATATTPVTLSWTVSGAQSLQIKPGVGTVTGTSVVVRPADNTTYTLIATNAAGDAVQASTTIRIVPAGLSRIRVDRTGAAAVFRDAEGNRFVPRGASYVRLNWAEGGHHSTFQPGLYNPATIDAALGAMEADGYNLVRVFIDHGEPARATGINGAWTTPGLDPAYLDNVADFLSRATRHHVHVLFALEYFPMNQHYLAQMAPSNPAIGGSNTFWLDGPAMQAKAAFVRDLIDGLAARLGPSPLSSVFAYELESEMFHEANALPFSLASGTVTTADGGSYNLALAADRQAAADNNAVHYANLVTDAVKSRDPDALVTIGAFTWRAVGKAGPAGLPLSEAVPDPRFPVRIRALAERSRLDFIDLHLYPNGAGYTLAADLASSEWSDMPAAMPVIMGEFGAFEMFYPDIAAAADLMRAHQIEAWNRGLQGYLYWTWDCEDEPWPQLWTLIDGDGAIDAMLAPVVRPDPAQP